MATTTPQTNQTGVRLAILSLVVVAAALAAAPASTRNPFQAHISYVGTRDDDCRIDDCRIDDGQIRC